MASLKHCNNDGVQSTQLTTLFHVYIPLDLLHAIEKFKITQEGGFNVFMIHFYFEIILQVMCKQIFAIDFHQLQKPFNLRVVKDSTQNPVWWLGLAGYQKRSDLQLHQNEFSLSLRWQIHGPFQRNWGRISVELSWLTSWQPFNFQGTARNTKWLGLSAAQDDGNIT